MKEVNKSKDIDISIDKNETPIIDKNINPHLKDLFSEDIAVISDSDEDIDLDNYLDDEKKKRRKNKAYEKGKDKKLGIYSKAEIKEIQYKGNNESKEIGYFGFDFKKLERHKRSHDKEHKQEEHAHQSYGSNVSHIDHHNQHENTGHGHQEKDNHSYNDSIGNMHSHSKSAGYTHDCGGCNDTGYVALKKADRFLDMRQ